jgi:hypothetical protein
MAKRITKKMFFLYSLVIMGTFGLVQNIFLDNFSKSRSAFKNDDTQATSKFFETAHADIAVGIGIGGTGDGSSSDGSGDGSNAF